MHPEQYHNTDQEVITSLRLQLHHEKCRRELAESHVKIMQDKLDRLRKAGDLVLAAYCMGDRNVEKWSEYPVAREWLQAKGDNPSVDPTGVR